MKYIIRPIIRFFLFIISVFIIFLGIVLSFPIFLIFGIDIALNWVFDTLEWIFDKTDKYMNN
ncbi:MAG: hypothetical protein ACOC1K_08465 [Nanoarchaeota archaeon]